MPYIFSFSDYCYPLMLCYNQAILYIYVAAATQFVI